MDQGFFSRPYLVNIYFLNNKAVSSPNTNDQWLEAINKMKSHLGLKNHKHSEYIIDLFIDVEDL